MQDNIIRDIKNAYGSLERPDWSFVTKRMKDHLYDDLVNDLARICFVEETTDLNDDVSRCFAINQESQAITLRLSLVGGFACAQSVDCGFLSRSQVLHYAFGKRLSQLLQTRKVEILDQEMLREEIDFGGEKCELYKVLFSSDELNP